MQAIARQARRETGGIVTENADRPTPEEVRASFALVESYDEKHPDDPVAESERAVLCAVDPVGYSRP